MPAFELRDYQRRLVADMRRAYAGGARSILGVMPTGAGKSATIAHMAARHVELGGTVLTIVHTRELLAQAKDALKSAGIAEPRVETIQSAPREPASFVWVDEAERGRAPEWSATVQHYRNSGAIVIGTTATPCRADGAPLGDLFDAMVVGPTVAELTERGVLVPCTVFAPARQVEGGVLEDPVRRYREHGEGGQAFVYCRNVSHAESIAAQFSAADLPAAVIEGNLHEQVRAERMARFRSGELRVLCSVSCLDAGVDVPAASVCILAVSCAHVRTYLQRVGRVLRSAPGKMRAVVIDLIGSSLIHGLPTDPREYSLTGKPIRSVEALAPISQCPQCGACFRAAPRCPRCGRTAPPPPLPREVRGELSEIFAKDDIAKRRDYFARMVSVAKERGYKPSWPRVMFRAKYGENASKEVTS
jgi:DNA repair protein RadD